MSRKITMAKWITIVLLGLLCPSGKVQFTEAGGIIEAGDWVKYEVSITPILEGEVSLTGIQLEFTEIIGSNVTVHTTVTLSDGDEWNEITTIDIVSGSNTGLIIPANSKSGDVVHVSGYGDILIESETTLIYTGVNRTTVFGSFTNSTDSLACFWDRQTGIVLEQNITKNESSTLIKILDTNMWQTQLNEYPPYRNVLYGVLITVVILIPVTYVWLRKKKPRRRAHRRTVRRK